ncbi:ABC transporter permease [Vibrio natriegens]|uniref:amino acid ABC transporter permease n=1 Tax=Vibrio natriegens TaxID=691 RepID=UPI000803E7CD|nr:ABC transporter permease subunit [Vibrio natriegens]ANQ24697.1 ABC transporter permease [Vibrio natriegens]
MLTVLQNKKLRDLFLQVIFVVICGGLLLAGVLTIHSNIEAQGVTSGFDFLERSTGFDIGFSLISFSSNDSYGRLILISIFNTVVLGGIGIILANIVGLIIAIFRTSNNALLNLIGTIYVEIFRNVPLILQVMFWYAVLTHLPAPREAVSLFGMFFASARGIYTPSFNVEAIYLVLSTVALIAGLIITAWLAISRRWNHLTEKYRLRMVIVSLMISVVLSTLFVLVGRDSGTPFISYPKLKGLNFSGGLTIPPEFAALAIGMAIYGGAYLGEIIRSGLTSVGKGQNEAAKALGLKPWQVFCRIRLPLATRAVLPTLINQYVWLFKATTLGIAVGFTDLFSVVSVAINQSGQTLELIAILMGGFLIMNNVISLTLNRVNKAIALRGTQLRI